MISMQESLFNTLEALRQHAQDKLSEVLATFQRMETTLMSIEMQTLNIAPVSSVEEVSRLRTYRTYITSHQ